MNNLSREEFYELAQLYAENCGETGELSPAHHLAEIYEGKADKDEQWDIFMEFVADYS